MSIQIFYPFLNWIFFSVELYDFFMYFGYQPLIRYIPYIYFLHSVGCLCILLMVSFAIESFSVWCSPTCLFLLLSLSLFCVKKIIAETYVKECFLLGVLWFQVLCSGLNSFWVNFCLQCKIVVKFHSFACGCPVLPVPFIEETLLSPLYILGSFIIN